MAIYLPVVDLLLFLLAVIAVILIYLAYEIGKLKKAVWGTDPRIEPGDLRAWPVADALLRAVKNYQVPHYEGNVHLFLIQHENCYELSPGRVVNAKKEFLIPQNGWKKYAIHLIRETIPGDHDSLLDDPNVAILATKVWQASRSN